MLKERYEVLSIEDVAERQCDFDIVHVLDIKHFEPSLLRNIKSPLIVDVHDCYWMKGESLFPSPDMAIRLMLSWRRRVSYQYVLREASAVIVHSRYVLSRLGHENVYVVPYAVEDVKPGIRLKERPPFVVFAGRDYFRKGLPLLLDAWDSVRRMCPGARLFIVGKEYPHERFLFSRLKMDKTISFLGDLERMKLLDYMRQARAVVLPSWTEAFGIVLIEAMAAGAIAIGTNSAGITEALRYGEAGFLVERGDKHALAEAILRTLDDDSRLEMLVERGLRVAKEHSVKAMMDSLELVYLDVMRKSKGQR